MFTELYRPLTLFISISIPSPLDWLQKDWSLEQNEISSVHCTVVSSMKSPLETDQILVRTSMVFCEGDFAAHFCY